MIADLKPYAEYKESGLPWLGQVPGHWAVKRAKSIFRRIDERSKTGREELLTVSSARGVVPRKTANVTMFKAESYLGYKLCWPGDLVINSLWAWAGGLGVSKHHGIISSAYGVYRIRADAPMSPAFAHEFVRSSSFNWELRVRSKGVWISRLQLTDIAFLDAPIHIPPPDEQAAIVRFLDWANGRLERAIRAKRKVIALLGEQKQAIIHRAVTRGINPAVPLRPSGIPWLGDIPDHWEVRALKRVVSTKITDGPHETPELLDDGIDFMSAESMVNGRLVFERRRGFISRELHEQYCTKCRPQRDDVFMCKSGATTGKVAIVETDREFSVWSPLALLRANREVILPRFLFMSLQTKYVQQQVQERWSYGTQPNLSMGAMGRLSIAVPTIPEQAEALQQVEEQFAPLTVAVSRLEREIELLREYRTRLVADVVTGRLDVRVAAAQLPDEAPPDTVEDDTDLSVDPEAAPEEAAV
jgi:type I restriction enzyme, S subunit